MAKGAGKVQRFTVKKTDKGRGAFMSTITKARKQHKAQKAAKRKG